MAQSDTITGRKEGHAAFQHTRNFGGCFVVTAYTHVSGPHMRYTNPTYVGRRSSWDKYPQIRGKSQGAYRVIVTPKGEHNGKGS